MITDSSIDLPKTKGGSMAKDMGAPSKKASSGKLIESASATQRKSGNPTSTKRGK